jgi:predicted nucleic acid-binding protein
VTVVVSDTSPLHYLILCQVETILPQLFDRVLIPPTVFSELRQPNTPSLVRSWADALPAWVTVQAPSSLDLTLNLDKGEAEAICLAREIKAAAILMDDAKGRGAAARYGLVVTGTLGLIEAAADRGLIQLLPTVSRLQQTNARLDPELIQAALQRHRRPKSS